MVKKSIYFMILIIICIMIAGCNQLSTTTTTTVTTNETSTTSETTTTTTAILYEVIFDSMGGTNVNSLSIPEGDTINLPIVEKEGYSFEGWYYDESYSTPYITTLMPAEDINLYAKWEINQYSIQYYTLEYLLNLDETILSTSFAEGHSSAVTSDGRLFIWGDNYKGKLGNGSTSNQYSPVDISPQFGLDVGETIIFSSLGTQHSSAITSNGRVFTWGYNNKGQLGDNTIIDKNTPTEITSQFNLVSGEEIVSLSLGAEFSAAVTSEGRLFTWGYNNKGQLGDGTLTDRFTPTDITSQFSLNSGELISSVSLGDYHSSALTTDGRVFTWGFNNNGQLGDGTLTDKHSPQDITTEFNFDSGEHPTAVSLGEEFSALITSEGRVFTWGNNVFGQLGDNTTIDRSSPTDITSEFDLEMNEKINSISLGGDHSAATTSNGDLYTWGYNSAGQLGDGSRDNESSPMNITSQFSLNVGETIESISLGSKSSSAVTSEGRTYTWGYNAVGQLGDGAIYNIKTPYNLYFTNKTLIISETYNYDVTVEEYTPTMDGYSFGGWYVDESLETPYVFTTMPAEDINLYAKWIED